MNSNEANRTFTSLSLRLARAEAKRLKIELPKMSTWKDFSGHNPWYEVWANGDIIWQGSAYNASEAKTNAIQRILASHEAKHQETQATK